MQTLYQDHLVRLTENELRVKHYYFPWVGKSIPLSDIQEIVQKSPSLMTGKWRIWGTRSPYIWYALDWKRFTRDAIFVARLQNKRVKVGFTVENSGEFAAAVSGKVPFRRVN